MASAGFGDRPITAITAADILATLRKVEAKGNYESAKRLRSTIGQVFRYAIATARAENDPTYGLRGALIAPKVSHMAAITDWTGFGDLICAIWDYKGGSPSTRAALKLMAILYTLVCSRKSGPLFELVPASDMELRHGQESQT